MKSEELKEQKQGTRAKARDKSKNKGQEQREGYSEERRIRALVVRVEIVGLIK